MSEKNSCCGPDVPENEAGQGPASHRENVQDAYAKVARANDAGESCGPESSCCGVSDEAAINTLISTRLGYSTDELDAVPSGADMGLGCGNPRAIASLKPGEVVVDLGSGGGFDCFLAAHEVGTSGKVIGVDMTPDMVNKAKANAEKGNYENVEFRLGEIELLPIPNETADVTISNCVVNLSANKPQVFREAYRVLKFGGRLAISDVVATVELPEQMRVDKQLVAGCMGNASLIDELESTEMYLTILFAVVDPGKGEVCWANAGHPHAFVVRRDGEARRLEATSPPLGTFTFPDYGEEHIQWEEGDLLLLFTDGLSDAFSDGSAMRGEGRLLDEVRGILDREPRAILDHLFATAGAGQTDIPPDDRTAVLLRS